MAACLWMYFATRKMNHKRVFAALVVAYYLVGILFRNVLPPEALTLLSFACYLLLPLPFSQGKPLADLAKNCVITGALLAADMFSALASMALFGAVPEMNMNSWADVATGVSHYLPTSLCVMVPAMLAVRAIGTTTQRSNSALLPVGFLALAQMAMVVIASMVVAPSRDHGMPEYNTELFGALAATCVAALIVNVLVLMLSHAYQRATERMARQSVLNDSMRTIGAGMEQIKEASLRLHRLRHDLSNQLLVVNQLIASRNLQDAYQQLTGLRSAIDQAIPATVAKPAPATIASSLGEGAVESNPFQAAANERPTNPTTLDKLLTIPGIDVIIPVASYASTMAIVATSSATLGLSPVMTLILSLVGLAACSLVQAWIRISQKNAKEALDAKHLAYLEECERSMRNALDAQAAAAAELKESLLQVTSTAQTQVEQAASQLEDAVDQLDSLLSRQTGHDVLNALLEAKAREVQQHGMLLSVSIPTMPALTLNNLELASMVCNMIDNARHGIEAADLPQDQPRAISLSTTHMQGMLLISCENPCGPLKNGLVEPNRTHRKKGRYLEHGWGMEIIQLIAEKNGGFATFEVEDGRFTATAALPLQ